MKKSQTGNLSALNFANGIISLIQSSAIRLSPQEFVISLTLYIWISIKYLTVCIGTRGHRTSNIRVRMFDDVRYFLNIEMFDVRMFANIQMFESSNVRMFANIWMFKCSMFECSLKFDCSKVRMFACSLVFEYSNVRCSNVRRYPNVRKFECSDVR